MLSALISLTLLGQQAQDLPTTPNIPPMTNRSFHEAVLAVEEQMSKGDFAKAQELMKALPRNDATITWDDSNVPADLRPTFIEARDAAIRGWKQAGYSPEFKFGPKGHLVIRFEKQLPDTELGIPSGAGHMFSFDPNEARLTTVIGLTRGKPGVKTLPSEVTNEVSHAIAAYLGLERSLLPSGARFRTDMPSSGVIPAGAGDNFLVTRLQKVIDTLKLGISKKVKFEARKPKLHLELKEVATPPVLQGDEQSFSMTVTNNGEAPLTLWVEPDCACLAPYAPNVIQPGQSGLMQVRVNTIDFLGKLRKWIYVYSNDLDFPFRQIPVDVDIRPLFRFIPEQQNAVVQMSEEGASTSFLFWTESPEKIKPDQFRFNGLQAEVEMKPWEGEMADPEMGEDKKHRKGYRFEVKMQPKIIFGRVPGMLVVSTNHEVFSTIRSQVLVQRGIVALPERLYLGEVKQAATLATFSVSRPETNFKVTKVNTDSPHVKVSFRPTKGEWEYRIDVEIDGKIPFGIFSANVYVYTDDPKQPEIIVPIEATVR